MDKPILKENKYDEDCIKAHMEEYEKIKKISVPKYKSNLIRIKEYDSKIEEN